MRGTTTLYSYEDETGADGTLPVTGDELGVPAGPLTVRAQLLDASGRVIQSESVNVFVNGLILTSTPSWLVTRAGTSYGVPLKVSVSDARGSVKLAGLPVTFTLPGTNTTPGATFPGNLSTLVVNTNANGEATSTVPTARPLIGSFNATVSTPGAGNLLVPMAARYGFSSFVSPVSSPTSTTPTGTTPVKISALLANGTRISDAEAATIVSQGRFQIRWRLASNTGPNPWIDARTNLATYDAKKDFFQADLKASTLGLAKNTSYVVMVRILPVSTQPAPSQDPKQGEFDLGSSQFTLNVSNK